jgi:hypothetical protein
MSDTAFVSAIICPLIAEIKNTQMKDEKEEWEIVTG